MSDGPMNRTAHSRVLLLPGMRGPAVQLDSIIPVSSAGEEWDQSMVFWVQVVRLTVFRNWHILGLAQGGGKGARVKQSGE